MTLWVVPDVNGEPGSHCIMRGAALTYEITGTKRNLRDIRVVQGVSDLFEDEACGRFEVQGQATPGVP